MPYRVRWIDRKTGEAEDSNGYYYPEDPMAHIAAGLAALSRPIAGHPLGFRYEIRPRKSKT